MEIDENIRRAAEIIRGAKRVTAFTGAGISVESGIPPFRGENGLWNRIDPRFLDISYFRAHPEASWKLIKEIFYEHFGQAKPNAAHYAIAKLEKQGFIKTVITQNIDNLHQLAGSTNVYEFHGTCREMVCINCQKKYLASQINIELLPPKCKACNGILKPDCIFFGEPIPEPAKSNSFAEVLQSDVFLLVGTTGEIMPASLIPMEAAKEKAKIIEVNIAPSNYTYDITNIFLKGKATSVMQKLENAILN
jgi:NAD-dependent deacetylase